VNYLKIKILEKNDTEIKFLLEDSNPQFANALRRIMIGEIPILTIGSVDFTFNDSVLYNEIIAHRMGLIPIVFNPKDFEFKEGEESTSSNEVIFAINKKGPGMVYSKDMKSSNPDVKPLYDNIPIVELFDDQKLKLEASATLGLGINHARYQAANAFYRYYSTVKVNGKISNVDEIIRSCPKGAINFKDNKVTIEQECDICRECVKAAKPEGVLEILGDNTKFIFTVESISGLKPEEITTLSVDILKKKVKDFDKEVKKL
jgi:DNA-directed RNA polymerase subunit D